MQKIIRLPLWSVPKSKPAPSATSPPYSHAGFLVSHVHDSERIKTLYGSVLGGMTVLTGGACQLTGLPELAIQLLPTGWGFGGPLGVANRATAATYNRAGG
jgi:cell division ATPase FtsA